MFLIRKLVHSLNIEGRRRQAGVIFIESKQNIIEEVADSISFRGGLSHSIPGGIVAVFLDKTDGFEMVKAAIEILNKSKGLGVRAKIGVSSGELIVEETPTGLVKYAALGNTLSFAKRMAKVENSIVIADSIKGQVGESFRFEKMDAGWLIKGGVVENW